MLKVSRFATLSAASVFLCGLSAASAQEPASAQQIRARIASMERSLDAFELFNYKTIATVVRAQPRDAAYETTMSLKVGEGRLIAAFCEPDCTAVEVKILDADGATVEEDKDVSAVGSFAPEKAGNYKVVVTFPGCAKPTCDVGIIVRSRMPRQ